MKIIALRRRRRLINGLCNKPQKPLNISLATTQVLVVIAYSVKVERPQAEN